MFLRAIILLCVLTIPLLSAAAEEQMLQSEVDIWATFLKPKHFGDREIIEGKSVIEIRVPQRAEDAGVV